MTCGRDPIVSLLTEGCEIHVNPDYYRFRLSYCRVHAVFWRDRDFRMVEWILPFPTADELLREVGPIRSHILLSRSQLSAFNFYEFFLRVQDAASC